MLLPLLLLLLDYVNFELYDTDISMANSLRRIMLAEVPILCIGTTTNYYYYYYYTLLLLLLLLLLLVLLLLLMLLLLIDIVNIENNTTSMQDEYISHRLGLIPIRSARPMSEWNYNHDCECDYCCDMCSVTFTLGIIYTIVINTIIIIFF